MEDEEKQDKAAKACRKLGTDECPVSLINVEDFVKVKREKLDELKKVEVWANARYDEDVDPGTNLVIELA